ncbi:MAG: IPT/TIG domain-containing protein, partial [Steroidobacteraceae bacterium]
MGNLYIADEGNDSIRRVAISGSSVQVTTLTGSRKAGYTDGGLDIAQFRSPQGIAFAGALWISDSANDAIRRIDAQVTIVGIDPHTGAASGGTEVHVLGSGFVPGATQVMFGSDAATTVAYVSSAELLVTAPAVTGIVDVTVTTPGGSATLPSAYSTVPPPAIATIAPRKGAAAGGQAVVITGTNFMAGITVTFGSSAAVGVTITSGNSLTAIAPPGSGTVGVTVTTEGGTASQSAAFTYFAPPVIDQFSPASGAVGTTVTITGSNFDVDPGATTVALGTLQVPITSIAPARIVVSIPATAATSRMTVTSTGGSAQTATSFTVTVPPPPGPPDPTSIATPVDIHSVADFNSTIQFLYTGPNAIQTGVTPGAIINTFASVIRGQVLTDGGAPLSDVRVAVHARPEFGSTVTRADGRYDLVVNGGTTFAVDFTKGGFITAQRDAHVERGDFAATADVMLIAYDAQATAIVAGGDLLQVARGSQVVDGDGARQATLLFAAGTAATMTLPNGTTQVLQTLTVRATEYTVGANGPKRMPAVLPAQTGYTYAAEFSVDEAVTAGATEVQFSKPVATYVDNFLHFPTGTVVPSGYYDRRAAAWVPSDNGRVIAVLSVSNGLADLDTDGDGAADNGLGIDDAERLQLASLYPAGQTLWRVPITHFTTWDYNWTASPPDDAIAPGATPGSGANPDGKDMTPSTETTKDDACKASGSIIECENQTLGEEVPITGTPFSLHYESDRMAGRDTRFAVRVPLTPHVMPASMTAVEVKVTVAGRTITRSYAPAPDLADRIVWDGVDAYGRTLQGSRPATVEVSYIYPAIYRLPGDATRAWASVTGLGVSVGVPARNTISISRSWNVRLGGWRNPKDDFGGWTISPQHTYDWLSKTILGGDGERRTGVTAVGNGIAGIQSFGSTQPSTIAYGPDGSLYIGDRLAIRRVMPNASTSTVVISLTGAAPTSIAVDREGNIYYSQ